jgi:hypothetical protein
MTHNHPSAHVEDVFQMDCKTPVTLVSTEEGILQGKEK